ncbi:MAG: hypothetical protein ACOYL6_15400 [Bacteriovoracaceae bacterium]
MKWFLLLTFFSLLCQAKVDCGQMTKFKSIEKSEEFCFMKESDAFISKSCLSGHCAVLGLLVKAKELKLLKSELAGGGNSSSLKCAKLGGKALLYRDENQNQQSFCEASDGSKVSMNSL